MESAPSIPWRQVAPGVRRLTLAISVLAFIVGPLLYLLPDQTDTLFAWTIKPPLTAAFLGASYLTALAIELLAARERLWARARIVYPAMLLFTTLTLVATLLHLDRFHFEATGLIARGTAYAWFVIYVLAPPVMAILFVLQLRAPGTDPPARDPLPGWFRAALAAQAIVMLAVGATLFIAPQTAGTLWPWTLTPLTGRAVGAWLLGLGLGIALAWWENDWQRIHIALAGNTVAAALWLGALLRLHDNVQWGMPAAWVYVVGLFAMLAIGVYGWYMTGWRGITREAPSV